MNQRRSRARRPSPPAHLGKEAAAIWRHTTAYLDRSGRLDFVDEIVVEGFCMAAARLRALQAGLERAGVVLPDGKPNPLLRTIEATATSVKNFAHVLGLTAGARRALPIRPVAAKRGNGKTSGDVWAGVLK